MHKVIIFFILLLSYNTFAGNRAVVLSSLQAEMDSITKSIQSIHIRSKAVLEISKSLAEAAQHQFEIVDNYIKVKSRCENLGILVSTYNTGYGLLAECKNRLKRIDYKVGAIKKSFLELEDNVDQLQEMAVTDLEGIELLQEQLDVIQQMIDLQSAMKR